MSEDDVVAIVRDGYDRIAEQYMAAVAGAGTSAARDDWTNRLLERLRPGSTVLDLGCGSGVPTAATITAAGHQVVGVDISPRQIELARRNVPQGSFLVSDVTDLRPEPGSFDAVAALFSLTHVQRDRYAALFARLVAWLRPGGWLLASMGTSDEAGWNEENFLGFGHTNWTNGFDPDTTRTLLTAAGFDLEEAEVVAEDTPFGRERWLWILGRAPGSLA